MSTKELRMCVCGFLSYGQRVKMENKHNYDLMRDSDFWSEEGNLEAITESLLLRL
jgi:hypothetical protein